MRLCASKKLNLFLCICIISVFAFALFFALSGSKTSARTNGTQQIKTVVISRGDTLWSIAKKNYTELDGEFSSYVDFIKETNNIQSQNLIVGNYILVPYYDTCS